MSITHKSKTLSCFLSLLGGSLGLHRFYLHGQRDTGGWIYLGASALYLLLLSASYATGSPALAVATLFPVPVFVAAIETLVIGLTDDAKWDARHNLYSQRRSKSGWPLAVLLVLTLAVTFTGFVASMARATVLLYTGRSYG